MLAAPWWKRTALSDVDSLPGGPAIYCIYDDAAREPEPAYVGETSRLRDRAISHAAARWPMSNPWLAYEFFPVLQSMFYASLSRSPNRLEGFEP